MINHFCNYTSNNVNRTPTIDGKENSPEWPVFDKQMQRILHVNSYQPNVIRSPFEETYAFWKKLSLLTNLNNLISVNNLASEKSGNLL